MSTDFNAREYEVEFLNCIVDKSDNYKIIDSDKHFSQYFGMHISKIHQGKMFLQDIIAPQDRQRFFERICKKESPYVYIDFDVIDKDGKEVYMHCSAQNYDDSDLCRLALVDISRSREKAEKLKEKADEIGQLIDLVTGGVCLFKATKDMHLEVLYLNEACCELFDTTKESYGHRDYRIDELIHRDDKTLVYQAIGKTMATGEDMDLEFRVKRGRASYMWCKCGAAVHKIDEDGCPIFHAVFTDISRIKKAEAIADEANEKLVNLLKNLSGAMYFTTPKNPFKCELVSGDFIKLIGYTRSEFFEKYNGDLGKLISDDKDKIAESIRTQIGKNGTAKETFTIQAKGLKEIKVQTDVKLVSQGDKSMQLICELYKF